MKCPHCHTDLDGVTTHVPAQVYLRYNLDTAYHRNGRPILYTEEEGSDCASGEERIFCEHCGQDICCASDDNIRKYLDKEDGEE